MATLRNKRKVAAVLRETPEGSRNSRGQSTLEPELTQDYISQVSEEIEGRVSQKHSKEINRTELCILGALSKLDEFLLNPQVRTYSVAVPEHPGTIIQKTGKQLGILLRRSLTRSGVLFSPIWPSEQPRGRKPPSQMHNCFMEDRSFLLLRYISSWISR